MNKQNLKSISRSIPVPVETIERRIYLIGGQKVMLDRDLAGLYRVETFNLNKAVKINRARFPADFMFQLTKAEAESLTFQNGISKSPGRGGSRHRPYAFTEHGVAMLSSILRSKRAVQMNILIIRIFVKLRAMLGAHKHLARKVDDLERTQNEHGAKITTIYDFVGKLVAAPEKPKRSMGFR
jgi:hypothetical protein